MESGKLKIGKAEINAIEKFIEDICKVYHIKNSFQGNIFIAVAEMISLINRLGGDGKVQFVNGKEEIKFIYNVENIKLKKRKFFEAQNQGNDLNADEERSIFLIMGLCDDLRVDEAANTITITFEKENIINTMSSHRREYLRNYLGKINEQTHSERSR